MTYRNNYSEDLFADRYFTTTEILSTGKGTTNKLSAGGDNIEAGSVVTFKQNLMNPFDESMSADSALFELRGYIVTNPIDRIRTNDTVRFYQFFKDYFARDDGCPESGYGFTGYNAQDCAVACRYETFVPDTVQAVMLYFNPTDNNVTAQYRFKIAVWRDDNGRPGELAYLSSAEYSPKTTGRFTQFILEKGVYVMKYYWIGWVQVSSGFLNAGFDRNYSDAGNLWYNDGGWHEDFNNGTLMIRPVIGKRKNFSTSTETPNISNTDIIMYPNPASQYIRIVFETLEISDYRDYRIEIYDTAGRLHRSLPYIDAPIDVSMLKSGIYIVNVLHKKSRNIKALKLIINN
jgi:hypothetical protein